MARLLDDIEITRRDTVARYLLLSNAHDATGSVQVKFTPVRVVCQNTLNQALERGPAIRVAHTKEMQSRLSDAADDVLATIQRHFDEIGDRFRSMLKIQMSEANLHAYLNSVYGDPPRGTDEKQFKRAVAQVKRDRLESARLFVEGKGNDFEGVRGTLWAAYNGVTEYVDFHRTAHTENKWLENIWFGGANRIKCVHLMRPCRSLTPTRFVKDASSCDARLDKVEATAMQPNDLERKATDPAELLLEKVEYESKSDYGGKPARLLFWSH